jgi:hypothetical protein
MTEAEWLACAEPDAMLRFLRGRASDRKLRLFALACCRRISHLLGDERVLRAASLSDKVAAAKTDSSRAQAILDELEQPWKGLNLALEDIPWVMAWIAADAAWPDDPFHPCEDRARRSKETNDRERNEQASLMREYFGNPFRPLPRHPAAIAPLAEEIYAGAWELLPLLGEWLQEHGHWTEGEHCLDPAITHVKGCWVVDWVTGRE